MTKIEVIKENDRTTYTYDSFHRRLSKKHNNILENYIYQDQNEIGSLINNKITELRVLGIGLGADVALELKGTPYIPLHDASGNLRVLLDTTGIPIQNYRYTAFGEMEEFSYKDVFNPWRYSGKRFDPETGFTYFGRRYYAPDIGRWISPDPAGFADGPNLYTYVHNSPLMYIDQDGQFAILTSIAIAIVVSHAAEFALPYAVQYMGAGYCAAALSGIVHGYSGHYESVGVFSGDPGLAATEYTCAAIGTFIGGGKSVISLGGGAMKAGTGIAANVAKRGFSWYAGKTALQLGQKAVKETSKIATKTIQKTGTVALEKGVVKASSQAFIKGQFSLVQSGTQYSKHGLERLIQRGVTPGMADTAINKGIKFYDPKNKTINYVLKNGFASGKDLLIGTNPFTNEVKTVIRGTNLIRPRFHPID